MALVDLAAPLAPTAEGQNSSSATAIRAANRGSGSRLNSAMRCLRVARASRSRPRSRRMPTFMRSPWARLTRANGSVTPESRLMRSFEVLERGFSKLLDE